MEYSPSDQILQQMRDGNFANFKSELFSTDCHILILTERDLKTAPLAFFTELGHALIGTNVKELHLAFNWIGEEKAVAMALALRGSDVTKLDLSFNSIEQVAPTIAHALQGTNVTKLCLAFNRIGDNAPALVQALLSTGVTQLDLAWNDIQDQFALAQALQSTPIKLITFAEAKYWPRFWDKYL